MQRLSLGSNQLDPPAYVNTSDVHDSDTEKGQECLFQEERKTVLEFVDDLKGLAKKMINRPFTVDMKDLRVRGLSAQADTLESDYAQWSSTERIEKAVECREQALWLTPQRHGERAYQLAMLGTSLHRRFERQGNIVDIDKAIELLNEAMILTPDTHPNKLRTQNRVGCAYLSRFERLGELVDLENAIECHSRVVQLTPDGDPDKPSWLNNLGSSYRRRFERLGELSNMENAIGCLTQALQLTPDGDPHKPVWLNNLGNSHLCRFKRLGELVDVENAIKGQTQATQLTPNGHPDKPRFLYNLGTSYMRRFERFGELTDVENAMECHTQAIQLTPEGHPDRPSFLNTLGQSHLCRFERLGQLVDVETAIACQTQAVQLTPDDHPHKPMGLHNLGNSYLRRFERLGELSDIENAIDCQTQAVQLTPDDHPHKPIPLNNLGTSYHCRFECLGELLDLETAIGCQTRAVQLTPDGHPDQPRWLSNLGNSHARRFIHLGEISDLENAIECLTQAVQLAPDGHPEKPRWLNNLGNSYMRQFERLGELSALENGIECQTQAVHLTPDGHPDKPRWLYNLGTIFRDQFNRFGEPADLQRAHSTYQQGAQHVLTSPESQLICARQWARLSSLLGLSPQQAYERCMELVPHLIWLGTTINQRYILLDKVCHLASEAASWAISVHSFDLAVEWLEEGRSIVWKQIMQLRTPFDDLSAVNQSLALHLKYVASQLEAAGSRPATTSSWNEQSPDMENAAQRHRRMAAEWERGLDQARSIPGFENFLRPLKASELKLAAKDGPVIVINAHSTRWDALVIFPGCDDIAHVPLTKFHENEAIKPPPQLTCASVAGKRGERMGGFGRVNHGRKPEDSLKVVLMALWEVVVKPILDALACTRKLPIDELPHVTWCATGPLAQVPLHAAGPYDGSSLNAFDLVISSYAPSLSALLIASTTVSQPNVGVLAVGQKDTIGLPSLPWTEHELSVIKQHAKEDRFLQLDGSNATIDAVLNAMDEHSWVHLACHATQNPVNPSQSAFHLHDGELTLEAITKRQFRNKGLAFLSACETAQGDGKLPDEAVHLAAGMLMAGYPSVIATMWSIADADGPKVAGRVYAALLKDGKMDHRDAARALYIAVSELREKIGVDALQRWVPFIHIGV